MAIRRLNHAVLWVRDARLAARFYTEVLGFRVVQSLGDGQAIFLRADGSENDHDLGLFSVGARAVAPPGRPGSTTSRGRCTPSRSSSLCATGSSRPVRWSARAITV